jgi:hypothetical protein
MIAENCFCLKRKLSRIKMRLFPLSSRCPIEIILIFCVLFWFVAFQGERFYHLYFTSFLKELEGENIIKENEGAHVITILGHTIPLLVVEGDGGFNYVSTSLGCLWYMLIIIIWITKKPIQLSI